MSQECLHKDHDHLIRPQAALPTTGISNLERRHQHHVGAKVTSQTAKCRSLPPVPVGAPLPTASTPYHGMGGERFPARRVGTR